MKNRVVKLTVASVIAGFLSLGAGSGEAMNSHVDSALAQQSDVSVFYKAFLDTGVSQELNEDTEYTVFAPTNAAFAEIRPSLYPCFYSVQCRPQVAALIRNHIVPRNESISRFSKWGGGIPTLGTRQLYVEETYKDEYTVEGHRVLNQSEKSESVRVQGDHISLYTLDGVIASDEEMAPFRAQPLAVEPGIVTERTVTVYHAPNTLSGSSQVLAPGGYPGATPGVVAPTAGVDATSETTTTTRTMTAQ